MLKLLCKQPTVAQFGSLSGCSCPMSKKWSLLLGGGIYGFEAKIGYETRRKWLWAVTSGQRSDPESGVQGTIPVLGNETMATGFSKSKPVISLRTSTNPTTKIGSEMGGEFTYPKMVPLVLNHGQMTPK